MNREGRPNYAFIDSQNLHKEVRRFHWELDYLKLRNYLKNKYNVQRAYLFIVYIAANSDDGDFYCLIEYLVKVDKLEKILTPSNRYSSLLRKYSDYISSLDYLKNKLKKREAFSRETN